MTGLLIAAVAAIIVVLFLARAGSRRRPGPEPRADCSSGQPSPVTDVATVDRGYPDEETIALVGEELADVVTRGPFLVQPYLQLGSAEPDTLEILWASRSESGFSVELDASDSVRVGRVTSSLVQIESLTKHYIHSCTVSGLSPRETFTYRVLKNGNCVFGSRARAAVGPQEDTYRFAVVGDMGTGRPVQKRIAFQISRMDPDLLAITGDVTYRYGRVSEYWRRFFPIYNADVADGRDGAPLLRSVLSFTSAGNHCVAKATVEDVPSFDRWSDLYAYFYYWRMPLNGPITSVENGSIPHLDGSQERIDDFLAANPERFPRMGNYSFDFGNAHWLVLDANAYMDWTDEQLRQWVEEDLAAASGATWKIVNFHQPPFTSNLKHKREKRMRLLCDIFERHGVDIVFNGHSHMFERTFPLRFRVEPGEGGAPIDEQGQVKGVLTRDELFDGRTVRKPDGVIYIVTGAGGAPKDSEYVHERPHLWEEFTYKLVGDRHSFTVCDVEGDTMTLRQIDSNGDEIDRFVVSKRP